MIKIEGYRRHKLCFKKAHILGRFKTKREAVKARKAGEEEYCW